MFWSIAAKREYDKPKFDSFTWATKFWKNVHFFYPSVGLHMRDEYCIIVTKNYDRNFSLMLDLILSILVIIVSRCTMGKSWEREAAPKNKPYYYDYHCRYFQRYTNICRCIWWCVCRRHRLPKLDVHDDMHDDFWYSHHLNSSFHKSGVQCISDPLFFGFLSTSVTLSQYLRAYEWTVYFHHI